MLKGVSFVDTPFLLLVIMNSRITRHGDHERVILHIQNKVHRKAGDEARRENGLIELAGLDGVRFRRCLRHRLGLLG